MEWIGIIEGIMGLAEGYSETDCTWFSEPRSAQRHLMKRAQMHAGAGDFEEMHLEDTSMLLKFSPESPISKREPYWIGLHPVRCLSYPDRCEAVLLWDQINSKVLFKAATHAEAINFCTLFACGRLGIKSDFVSLNTEVARVTDSIFNEECSFFDFEETAIHCFGLPNLKKLN